MKYFIGLCDIEWSKNRYWQKGKAMFEGDHKEKKGYVGLFDRNSQRFVWFKIIRKCQARLEYVVERKKQIPTYWKNTINKHEGTGGVG